MPRRNAVVYALIAALLTGGCSPPPPQIVEAEGIVLLDGLPLPHAKVRFFPQFENASEYIAQGVTDEKGFFTLTCHGKEGACAIENIVTVTDEDIPERLTVPSARAELLAYRQSLKNRPIPDRYRTPGDTPIKVTVTAGQKTYKIDLNR